MYCWKGKKFLGQYLQADDFIWLRFSSGQNSNNLCSNKALKNKTYLTKGLLKQTSIKRKSLFTSEIISFTSAQHMFENEQYYN